MLLISFLKKAIALSLYEEKKFFTYYYHSCCGIADRTGYLDLC
jgi:hypothetical protein